MYSETEVMMARLYAEERLREAARERLIGESRRARRQKWVLAARVGRTLIRVGERLEAAGGATSAGAWERVEVA